MELHSADGTLSYCVTVKTVASRTIRNVLVAIDDSDISVAAVKFAVRLAKRAGASLTFCNAVDLSGIDAACVQPYADVSLDGLVKPLHEEAQAILAAAADVANAASVRAATRELSGPAPRAILEAAPMLCADAIVVGTHGHRGLSRLIFGSTAEEVLHDAGIPVFVVPAGANPGQSQDPFLRIAVAVDGSEAAAAALDAALDLAVLDGGRLSIVHAIAHDDSMLAYARQRDRAQLLVSAAATRAEQCGVLAETFILEGDPTRRLLKFVRSHSIDLLAMGTHGRRGLDRMLFGSVAESVARACLAPVLLVRRPVEDLQ